MKFLNSNCNCTRESRNFIPKKAAMVFMLSFFCLITFSQTATLHQRLKYVTTAPDGSVALMIYDDTNADTMKLEAANSFYRFEILDNITSETVYVSTNKGMSCTIDKTKLMPGTYNFRLYTARFVIRSKITITPKFKKDYMQEQMLAVGK